MSEKSRFLKLIDIYADYKDLSKGERGFVKANVKFFKESMFKERNVVSIVTNSIANVKLNNTEEKSVGIVVQGPIDRENNFTIEMIKRYRKMYPHIIIVLSTWVDSLKPNEIEMLERENCKIVTSNPFPTEDKGEGKKKGNLNNQIYSTRRGIEALNEYKVKYILKIRSDLILLKPDFIQYFINVLKLFDPNDEGRIINIAFSNNLMNVPFHLSDFCWFGKKENMVKLFSIPFRSKETLDYIKEKGNNKTFWEGYSSKIDESFGITTPFDTEWYNLSHIDEKFLLNFHEECYIAYNYFASIKEDTCDSLMEKYKRFVSEKIICIDEDDVNAFWNKGSYSQFKVDYYEKLSNRLGYAVWLNNYLENK